MRALFATIWLVMTLASAPHARADQASDPVLRIRAGGKTAEFKRSELIRRPDLRVIEIEADPSYAGQKRSYHAVPARVLFEGMAIAPGSTLEFSCLDGFSAPIDRDRLLNSSPKRSIAYLAIEMPDEKWPATPGEGGKSPAPYYLVWENPRLSKIGPEEWPFQLAGFSEKPSLAAQYPKIVPDSRLKPDAPVNRGFKVFTKNCFTCHTLNREGKAQMGPDLNVPMNPTEYLYPRALKALIRNPGNLRYWPQSKMSSFDEKAISNFELDDLVAYLRYMARHKR